MSAPDAEVCDYLDYQPGFLGAAEATALCDRLWRELDWSQRAITLFGREVLQPRLVAWYGDAGAVYTYSGLTLQPLPWHPALADLRRRIEVFAGHPFNAVLANAYRDGRDSMGWHADDEKELGPTPAIASVSVGAARAFRFRASRGAPGVRRPTHALTLEHGSLLVMRPGCQERFRHALPRTARPVGLRINLTWRNVRVQAPD
ncbi:MAG: alpha-ketoglutarate-dependent dioxygenase AlkB [Xanthomonadales bacterium]|nr:alpha-ketoglutarate-dependent dioxygenase AlkB [Xanthomonadales bacterium]